MLLSPFPIGLATEPAGPSPANKPNEVHITLHPDQPAHKIPALLFGQFMEIARNEPGPDAALDANGNLRPDALGLLRELAPPILRYPGGSRVGFVDWSAFLDSTLDNEPFDPGLPRIPKVGYTLDRFLATCEDLGSAPLLTVDARRALLKERDLAAAARAAAALVAYCNADPAALDDPWLRRWAGLRVASGRITPWAVRYWQIGNELWMYNARLKEQLGDAYPDWHATVIAAFTDAMRAVDPGILIITDADSAPVARAIRRVVGDRLHMLSEHKYVPWQIDEVRRGDTLLHADDLTPLEMWRAWTAVPAINSHGLSIFPFEQSADSAGYPVAVTEWNWNGWAGAGGSGPIDSLWAKGIGAAGFLHGLLRGADRISLAIQSVAMGNSWDITSIRIPAEGKAYFHPTGAVTAFHRHLHGPRFIPVETRGGHIYEQPFRVGAITPAERVAEVDVVATGGNGTIFLHILNRAFANPAAIIVPLPKGWDPDALLHTLGSDQPENLARADAGVLRATHPLHAGADGSFRFTAAPATLSCLQIRGPITSP